MNTHTIRLIIPTGDGDLLHETEPLEDHLLQQLAHATDHDDRHEADAIGELCAAIATSAAPPIYAPDGRYEHAPLALITIDHATQQAVLDALHTITDPYNDGHDPSLVDVADRLARLLTITWTEHHDRLANRLRDTATSCVLDPSDELSYRHVANDIVNACHHGCPLERWTY